MLRKRNDATAYGVFACPMNDLRILNRNDAMAALTGFRLRRREGATLPTSAPADGACRALRACRIFAARRRPFAGRVETRSQQRQVMVISYSSGNLVLTVPVAEARASDSEKMLDTLAYTAANIFGSGPTATSRRASFHSSVIMPRWCVEQDLAPNAQATLAQGRRRRPAGIPREESLMIATAPWFRSDG